MLLYVVMQHLKHRGIFVGIDDIPHVQAQRFIAIDRYPRGNKFVPSVFDFRKKVDDLPAVNIDNFDRLPFTSIFMPPQGLITYFSIDFL